MDIAVFAKNKQIIFLPFILVGILYLASYVFIHGYQFHVCPGGTGAQYYSCGDLDDYYNECKYILIK